MKIKGSGGTESSNPNNTGAGSQEGEPSLPREDSAPDNGHGELL